ALEGRKLGKRQRGEFLHPAAQLVRIADDRPGIGQKIGVVAAGGAVEKDPVGKALQARAGGQGMGRRRELDDVGHGDPSMRVWGNLGACCSNQPTAATDAGLRPVCSLLPFRRDDGTPAWLVAARAEACQSEQRRAGRREASPTTSAASRRSVPTTGTWRSSGPTWGNFMKRLAGIALFVFAWACSGGGGPCPESQAWDDFGERCRTILPDRSGPGSRWQPPEQAFREATSKWGLDAMDVEGVRLSVADIDDD